MHRATVMAIWCTCAASTGGWVSGCGSSTVDIFVLDADVVSDGGLDDLGPAPDMGPSRCDDPDLIACYAFEGDTSAAPDRSLNLAATSPTFDIGVFGQALTLEPTTLATAAGPSFDTGALSMDAWIRLDSASAVPPTRYIAQRGSSWAARLEIIAGVLVFSCVTTSGSSFAGPVSPGSWHHVACVFDGSRVLAYLDGVPALIAQTPLEAAMDTPLNVGHSSFAGDTPFEGAIDELRLWSRVLNASEIGAAATAP